METPDDLVARNAARLRTQRRYTVRSLSARLGAFGHPVLPSGITKIEQGERRVDAGDLVALAVALGVNPNRLLLPDGDMGEQVALTPAVRTSAEHAWAWARGELSLTPGHLLESDRSAREVQDDFRRHALPVGERLRDDHTAVRAARDVLYSVRELLKQAEKPPMRVKGRTVGAAPRADMYGVDGVYGPDPASPAGLRARLHRLLAEVAALIGDEREES